MRKGDPDYPPNSSCFFQEAIPALQLLCTMNDATADQHGTGAREGRREKEERDPMEKEI